LRVERWEFKGGKMNYPTYIQTKIPSGTSYKGYAERSPGRESFNEWFLNGFREGMESIPYAYRRTGGVEITRGPQMDGLFPSRGKVVGEYLMVSFQTEHPHLKDERGGICIIKWIIPQSELNQIWSELRVNPVSIFSKIDLGLLKLCPPSSNEFRFLREMGQRMFSEEG
jgi:hypothetical protein